MCLRAQFLLELLDEFIVHTLMDVDALDCTTALSRVEDRPINKLCSNISEIRILPHVCSVITSQFQTERNDPASGSFTKLDSNGSRARKCDLLDLRQSHELA